MDRICYVCGRDLREEPAIKRAEGLSCFPCCCNIDKHWDQKYAAKWRRVQKARSILKSAGFLAGFVTIIAVDFHNLIYPLIGICSGCFLVAYGIKYVYPRPPWNSADPLYRYPKIVFDEAPKSRKITDLLRHRYSWRYRGSQYDDRYPENWESIRNTILARDRNQCRICGKASELHVHHIKPISWGGNHTPQNLITLCNNCHLSQDYYGHKYLIEVSKLNWKKFRRLSQKTWNKRNYLK